MSAWKCSAPVLGVLGLALSSFAADYVPPSTAVSRINSYRGYSELTDAAKGMDIDQYAYNMTTWQIGNGGFYKYLLHNLPFFDVILLISRRFAVGIGRE